jgi:acyl-CoA thioesterase-1
MSAALAAASACTDFPGLRSGKFHPSPLVATRRIVVLGDSLSVSPNPRASFPAVLNLRLRDQRVPWEVTNAGVIGDTTEDGLRRLDPLLDDDVGIVILALGANDGLQGVPLATIEQNLATIVERVQAREMAVLLCGMETPPLRGLQYALGFHDIFPRLAARYNVPLVPFLLAGVALNPEMNGPDGIHPNAAGAERIADTVWPYLLPLLDQAMPSVASALRTRRAIRPS